MNPVYETYRVMLFDHLKALPWENQTIKSALEAICQGRWKGDDEHLSRINEIVNKDDAETWGVHDLDALRTCFRECIQLTLDRADSEAAAWVAEKEAERAYYTKNRETLAQKPRPPSVESYFKNYEARLRKIGLTPLEVDQQIGYNSALKYVIATHFDLFIKTLKDKNLNLEQMSRIPPELFVTILSNQITIARFLSTGVPIDTIIEVVGDPSGLALLKDSSTIGYVRLGVTLHQLLNLPEKVLKKALIYSNFLKYRRGQWDSFIARLA